MARTWCNQETPAVNRRELLRTSAAGFASVALAGLLQPGEGRANPTESASGLMNPLAPRLPHFAPTARRVIFLFMHGGPSQVDTFDYKPLLERDHGKPLPFAKPRVVSSATGNLLKSPFKFAQHGQSGAWVSELFPHVATQVDRLCIVNSMHGSNSRHGGALLELPGQPFANLARARLDLAPVTGLDQQVFGEPALQTAQRRCVGVTHGGLHELLEKQEGVLVALLRHPTRIRVLVDHVQMIKDSPPLMPRRLQHDHTFHSHGARG